MNTLDLQVYKDGNRTILVFNNCKPETENIISSVIGSVMGKATEVEQIENIIPMKTVEREMPNLSHSSNTEASMKNIVPEINENNLYEEKGFIGYIEVYNFYKQNHQYLSAERIMELTNFINMHAARMKSTDPKTIPLDDLVCILRNGLQTIFANKLPFLLQQTTKLTLEELLNSNRQVLEYCYTVCIS